MDKIDRHILRLLQRDGRMPATELARKVGLSVSASHRRLKDLENSGAITGYRATLSPEKLGLHFEAIVFVTIDRTDHTQIGEFERAVAKLTNVVEAERLFGDPDYMLRVRTRSLESYQAFYDSDLAALPGVARLTSTIVMKRLIDDPQLPVR